MRLDGLRRCLGTLAVVLSIVLVESAFAPSARAGFLSAFSGNTQPYQSGGVGGTVSFAVYDKTTSSFVGDTFGTGFSGFDATFAAGAGSAGLDTSARFLFLFTMLNNGPSAGTSSIDQTIVNASKSLLTSYGGFTGTAFNTPILGTPAGFGDPSPSSVGATPMIINAGNNATPSISVTPTLFIATFSPLLGSGQQSILFGFTTNTAPGMSRVGVFDGNTPSTNASGTAPSVVVPEPSAALLLTIALPLGLLIRRRLA